MTTLSNFYQTYADDFAEIQDLLTVYREVCDLLVSYVEQVQNDGLLGLIGTYRTIPLQNITVGPMLYDLQTLLATESVYAALDMADMTTTERMIAWVEGGVTNDQKVAILTSLGLYVQLSAPYGALAEDGTTRLSNGKVTWFELYNGTKRMVPAIDYIVQDRKLFLIGDYVSLNTDTNAVLQMRNIAIDFSSVERRFGINFNAKYTGDIALNEYNEIMQTLTKTSLNGPRIKEIRAAIHAIAGIDEIDVYDRFSRNSNAATIWNPALQEVRDGFIFTPFDYIVEISNENGLSDYRLSLLTTYLQSITPVPARFTLLLNLLYKETYAKASRASDAYTSASMEESAIDETMLLSLPTEAVLNNEDMKLNESLELYMGFIRSDEYVDSLIPV